MSFVAIVVTVLAVVILALVTIGLWHRRRPSDIWEEDVVRDAAQRSGIEQADVADILDAPSGDAEGGAEPPDATRERGGV